MVIAVVRLLVLVLTITVRIDAQMTYFNVSHSVQFFLAHPGGVERIYYSARHSSVFTCGWDRTIKQYTWPAMSLMKVFSGHSNGVTGLAFVNDRLISASGDASFAEWDVNGTKIREKTNVHPNGANDVMYDPRNNALYTMGRDNTIKKWDSSNWQLLWTHSHSGWVWEAATTVSGSTIAIGTMNGYFKVINDANGNSIFSTVPVTSAVIRRVHLSDNGTIVTMFNSPIMYDWDSTNWSIKKMTSWARGDPVTLKVTSKYIYLGCKDGSVQVLDRTSNVIVYSIQASSSEIWFVNVIDNRLLVGDKIGYIFIWDLISLGFQLNNDGPSVSPTPTLNMPQAERTLNLGLIFATDDATMLDKNNQMGFGQGGTVFEGQSKWLIIGGILLLLCTLVCGSMGLCIRCRRQRETEKGLTESTTVLTSTENPEVTTTAAGMTTIMTHTEVVTVHELSIPAFLQMKWGTDFKQYDMPVGSGGSSAIFLGSAITNELIQRSNGSATVVIKHFGHSIDALSHRRAKAFWQELSMMWKLRDQPYFPRICAYSTAPVTIVMKLYIGDLKEFAAGKLIGCQFNYSKQRVVRIFRQVCQALAYLHQNQIAHCDIKPHNIFMELSGDDVDAVLSDLGLTRVLDHTSLQVDAFPLSDLKGGSLCYAAPEVFDRFNNNLECADPNIWKAGDVFAIGSTIMHALKRTGVWDKTIGQSYK